MRKSLLTVDQVVSEYGISKWSIYQNIRSDPSFPAINIGPKKNYRIEANKLDYWLTKRGTALLKPVELIPSGSEILDEIL